MIGDKIEPSQWLRADVEEAIRPEFGHPAIVIYKWLSDRQDDGLSRVRYIRVGNGSVVFSDHRCAVCLPSVIDEESPIARV